MNKLRWGILSTAQIARKNWLAIRNSGNSVVTAVASRDMERSRQFITECQQQVPFDPVPTAFGSYEELLASKNVDAVYIPLPTGLRKEWVVRTAEAGKHVLCEKPCATSLSDLQEMIAACRKHRVQFMDGVMLQHSQRLPRIREALNDGTSVGQIKRITSQLSFRAPEEFLRGNIRMSSALEPHGCLGDIGWYCIRITLWTMNWQLPRQIRARILSQAGSPDSAAPVPTEFSAELLFDGGVSAGFYCSFLTEHQGWVHVSGTKGWLHVPDFVLPFSGEQIGFEINNAVFQTDVCDFQMKPNIRRIIVAEHSNSHPSAQESNMIRNFANQVQSGKLNDDWSAWSLKTQQVMEACYESARRLSDVTM